MGTSEEIMKNSKKIRSGETQKNRPGRQWKMKEKPQVDNRAYKPAEKLKGKVAIVTGGDSGIGHAVAIAYAKEGADIVIVYLEEHTDAQRVKKEVEKYGARCLLVAGDVGDQQFCAHVVQHTIKTFRHLDIVVNNAAEQHPQENFENISSEQLEKTFRTNIFGYFYLTNAALPHLKSGSAIVNCASVTAYRGSSHLVDYSSTKGAIVSFTRSLSQTLIDRGIRVNAVAPGAVWTPLIVSTFPAEAVKTFGTDNPMKRAAEPYEIAPSFVFLASDDSSFMTGQVLHPNGGEVVNG